MATIMILIGLGLAYVFYPATTTGAAVVQSIVLSLSPLLIVTFFLVAWHYFTIPAVVFEGKNSEVEELHAKLARARAALDVRAQVPPIRQLADLSDDMREILRCVGPLGTFVMQTYSGTRVIRTDGGTGFHDEENPITRLRYLKVFEELVASGVIQQESDNTYSLTLDGWRFVHELALIELVDIVASMENPRHG